MRFINEIPLRVTVENPEGCCSFFKELVVETRLHTAQPMPSGLLGDEEAAYPSLIPIAKT